MSNKKKIIQKGPGKSDEILGVIVGIGLFLAYRVGLATGDRWPYVLLLVLSAIILFFFVKNEGTFIKICAIINILYSGIMLLQPDFVEKWFLFNFVGKLLSVAFSIVVAFFGYLLGASGRWILYGMVCTARCFFRARKIRALPKVKNVAKRNERVHLYEDYDHRQTQLIYRKGRKKKILDTYLWEDDECPYYSIEWDGKKCVTVQKCDTMTFQKVEEKMYEI